MPLRRLFAVVLLLAASSAFVAGSAGAQADPSLFQGLRWRLIGPFRGGRVLAVAGVPGQPEHFYFGSVNGGVWESRDAGRTWQPVFDGQPIGSIGALAVAPSDPRVIYAGSGEADMRSDIAQGDGMYKSTDGGRTWSHVGLADSQQIGRVLIDPRNPDVVYVAALGHPYGPNAERGVFRSKDGGKNWQKVLGKDENTGAIDLAFEPGRPEVIYAALWQTRRTPWHIYPPSNGPGSGLYKSTDGGDHWTQILGHGLAANPGRIGLAVAPSQPQRVYAMVDAAEGGCAAGARLNTGDDAASRERTSAINALVSAAGSTSNSTATRFANSSYTCTAPTRSPRSSRSVTKRRSVSSSPGTSAAVRRAQWAARAKSPSALLRCASVHAAWHARFRNRARSSSSQRSNSGESERKKPSSRLPR